MPKGEKFAFITIVCYNGAWEKRFCMAMEYTEEQLNKLDKTALVQLFLMQQAQLKDIDHKLQ